MKRNRRETQISYAAQAAQAVTHTHSHKGMLFFCLAGKLQKTSTAQAEESPQGIEYVKCFLMRQANSHQISCPLMTHYVAHSQNELTTFYSDTFIEIQSSQSLLRLVKGQKRNPGTEKETSPPPLTGAFRWKRAHNNVSGSLASVFNLTRQCSRGTTNLFLPHTCDADINILKLVKSALTEVVLERNNVPTAYFTIHFGG